MARQVTERDFRLPEFADAKVEDYEFRQSDGKLVRKDRWEVGFRSVVSKLGLNAREFEVPAVVDLVGDLHHTMQVLYDRLGIDFPELDAKQGSVAVNAYSAIIAELDIRLPAKDTPYTGDTPSTPSTPSTLEPYDVGYLQEEGRTRRRPK